MTVRDWSTTPADNDAAPPLGYPEGQAASTLNDCGRQVMAEVRETFEESPYFDWGDDPTRVDNDTFTVAGDLTTRYALGLRVKLVGATTGYGVITASSHAAGTTTIDVTMDSGNVPTSLVRVAVIPEAVREFIAVASVVAPGGRLTLTTAVPVTTSDVTAATTVYYSPYCHDRIQLYNGTFWQTFKFTELSQTLADNTKSPAAATTNSNYDLFVWNDSGTLRCTRGPLWDSATARGTGAGKTELELYEGRYVNKVAITNGPAARRGLYVGTIRTDGSTQVNDALAFRHVWNNYNRVARPMHVADGTNSWSLATTSLRQANGSTANQLDFVIGLSEDSVTAQVLCTIASQNNVTVAVGLDSTTTMAAGCLAGKFGDGAVGAFDAAAAFYEAYIAIGQHTLVWLERHGGGGTTTIYGDNGDSTTRSGITGRILA